MALKKSELYSSLWSGCDELRGGMDASPYNDTSRWFLRDATIKAANTILVDHHHGLKLSSLWGDGSRSSSDGRRFAVERNSLLGSVTPPISTASTALRPSRVRRVRPPPHPAALSTTTPCWPFASIRQIATVTTMARRWIERPSDGIVYGTY
jgi:hypothetical protein